MQRSSGVLMPLSSLPSPYGIGSMGKEAYRFVDFLKLAGQTYWQLLPLCPTGAGDSPYSSFSTFAGNPYFIDLDTLIRDRLLKKAEVEAVDWGKNAEAVDYSKLYAGRAPLLRKAFARGRERFAGELDAFRKENTWVETYGLYMALKQHFDQRPWTEWPDEAIRMHRPDAVREWREKLKDEMDYHIFVQFLFFRQWDKLKEYAHKKGVSFIGDIPIYVALDSADVWSEPHYFQLDSENVPKAVAGVPPDPFTADGQLWGNPLYDWDAMAKDGFGWWIRRIEGAKKLYDMIRIDHFRGFESYWSVPYGETTAKNGEWKPGPGIKLVGMLTQWFHDLDFIAEDLGYVTPGVKKLVEDSGLARRQEAGGGLRPARHEDFAVCLRRPRGLRLSAPLLRLQQRLLHRHPRQRHGHGLAEEDPQDRPGVCLPLHAHHRRRGLVLGHDPRGHGLRLRPVRGADAGFAGAGRLGPDQHPGRSRRQLALAHEYTKTFRRC